MASIAPPPTLADDVAHCLSAALRTTPVMTRLYDPDHMLADATALQLIAFLEQRGIALTKTAAPYPRKAATAKTSHPKINNDPPTGATIPSPGPPNNGT
jgi:hypothetical protein